MEINYIKKLNEDIKSLSRGLMAHSPQAIYQNIELFMQQNEYIATHGIEKFAEAYKNWIAIKDMQGRTRYIRGEGLSGESSLKLPDGIEPAATFVESEKYDKSVQSFFQKTLLALYLIHPKDSLEKIEHERKKDRFTRACNACQKGYNQERLEEFRQGLYAFPKPSANESPNVSREKFEFFLQKRIEQLKEFEKQLAKERAEYSVDAILFASVSTIVEIIDVCLKNLPEDFSGEKDPQKIFTMLFSDLLLFITAPMFKEPDGVLYLTIQRATKHGFMGDLQRIAEKYREFVFSKIDAALEAQTVDESLDNLYLAIPKAHGALGIYKAIIEWNKEPPLDEGEVKIAKKLYRNTEEVSVRLRVPFQCHLAALFFNRNLLKDIRREIKELWKKDGKEAAEKYARWWIEEQWAFPKSFLPKLLSQNDC